MKPMVLGKTDASIEQTLGVIYRQQKGLIWAYSEQSQEGRDPLLGRDTIRLNCNTERTELGYTLVETKRI